MRKPFRLGAATTPQLIAYFGTMPVGTLFWTTWRTEVDGSAGWALRERLQDRLGVIHTMQDGFIPEDDRSTEEFDDAWTHSAVLIPVDDDEQCRLRALMALAPDQIRNPDEEKTHVQRKR